MPARRPGSMSPRDSAGPAAGPGPGPQRFWVKLPPTGAGRARLDPASLSSSCAPVTRARAADSERPRRRSLAVRKLRNLKDSKARKTSAGGAGARCSGPAPAARARSRSFAGAGRRGGDAPAAASGRWRRAAAARVGHGGRAARRGPRLVGGRRPRGLRTAGEGRRRQHWLCEWRRRGQAGTEQEGVERAAGWGVRGVRVDEAGLLHVWLLSYPVSCRAVRWAGLCGAVRREDARSHLSSKLGSSPGGGMRKEK